MITISTDSPEEAARMVTEQGLSFPVAHDTDRRVSKAWGIYNVLSDGLAAPATFVIDGTGELAFWKIGLNILDRPSAGEILAAVQDLVREDTT